MPCPPTFSMRPRPARFCASGFSFVEAIFTIAIIGIMSSLVVAAISNASKDAHRVMARQQQAAVQSAVTAWVMAQRVGSTGEYQNLESLRTYYNNLSTTRARFEKLRPDPTSQDTSLRAGFLDQTTVDHFDDYMFSSDRLQTAALKNAGQYLTLPIWQSGDFPRCEMNDE